MPLLPHDRFAFDSPLSPDEASVRLAGFVEPRRMIRFGRGPTTRDFEGEVAARSFHVQRVIGYNNSFLPRIRGTIQPGERGSRVEGTMSLHPVVGIFLCIWMGAAAIYGLATSVAAIYGGSGPGDVLIPCGMLLFGWVLTSGAFTFEARVARRLLMDCLAATDADARHAAERSR